MKKIVITFIFLLCFLLALPSHALEFTVKEKAQAVTIQADGWIYSSDIKALEHLIDEYSGNITLALNSPGGLAKAGMQMGLILKQNPQVTAVIESGQQCVSACALAFLGAHHRIIYPGGKIGFHRVFNEQSELDRLSRRDLEFRSILLGFVLGRYFSVVGINNELLYKSLDYGPGQMWFLSRSELKKYQVTTSSP